MQKTSRIGKRVRALAVLLPAVVLLASACQSVLGIESWTRKPAGPDAGSGCLRASDCTGTQVCLFQTCSEPCANDKDCQDGTYCLRTNDGTACVTAAQAQCGAVDCPAGSTCTGGRCLTTCADASTVCPGGQQCTAGACVSVAPDAGSGGSGGVSSGGGGPGDANAGAAGAVSVPVDDGTAVGALGAACEKNGALACDGHAQRGELLCQGGVWQSNGACAGSTLCDSTPGANAGSCQPIVSECVGQVAGYQFCRASETDLRACGLDLVTADVAQSCPFVCTAGACTGECHPTNLQCKAGNIIPQLCDATGTWQDQTACGYQCDPASGKCIAAGCKDGVLNGDETDIDCGGSCGGCPVNDICKKDADCIAPGSARCIGGKCAAASCTDGVKNGTETDADCGGSCPKACAVGLGCALNTDCVLPGSGHCSASKCVVDTCTDSVKNGDETSVDCGGSCPNDCAIGGGCTLNSDCASAACVSSKCVTCQPTTKQCVGTAVETCSAAGAWGSDVPCVLANANPSCAAGVCGIASCTSGFGNCDATVSNGCETNLDVATACGTTCANRVVCSTVHGTPSCPSGTCVEACAAGFGDCGGNNDGCETNLNTVSNCGTCAHTAVCNAPAQICTDGSCVTNSPYDLGQASASGWADFMPSSDLWYVVSIAVPRTTTVQSMQLIGRGTGGSARMGLWADDGTGHPGAFLAQTTTFSVAPGVVSGTFTPKPPASVVVINGGSTYWVGAKFTGAVDIYQNSSAGAVAFNLGQMFSLTPAAEDPFPSGSAGTISGVSFNFYLLVQDVPP